MHLDTVSLLNLPIHPIPHLQFRPLALAEGFAKISEVAAWPPSRQYANSLFRDRISVSLATQEYSPFRNKKRWSPTSTQRICQPRRFSVSSLHNYFPCCCSIRSTWRLSHTFTVGLLYGIRIHCAVPSNPSQAVSYLHYSHPSFPPPTPPNISTQVQKALTHLYTPYPSPPVIACLSYPSLSLCYSCLLSIPFGPYGNT
jgi:hypothetical protein